MREATTKQSKSIILASSSPRRQAFLHDLGLDFAVMPADVDETPLPAESPTALARRLAESKAQAVAARLPAGRDVVVVAADTIVAMGMQQLGKPDDKADASRMLAMLRDREHEVHSAVCVLDAASGCAHTRVNTTVVWMRNYSDKEIATYVESGDPLDKAGAYAIQHPEFNPAQTIDGCLSNVVGLPLDDLCELLVAVGIEVPGDVVEVCEAQTHFACCRRTR